MRLPDKIQALGVLRSRNIPIETIIDVGVQTATSELITMFPDKPHLLFEPVSEFVGHIHANYKKIDYTLVEAAVSDKEGDITLQTVSIVGGAGISHSEMVSGPVDSADKRTVPMVTLDGYLARHPRKSPYFLKLDVDGFELQIMRGAIETLKNTSVVMVEATKNNLTQRVSFLEAHEFQIFDLVEPCYYDQSFWQCDVVMVNRSLHTGHFAGIHDNFSPTKYEAFRLTYR